MCASIAVCSALGLLIARPVRAEAEVGGAPTGVGSVPVTPMHGAAWFLRSSDKTTEALELLVYFEGAPGWVEGPSNFEWKAKASPSTIDIKVGPTAISVQYWAETSVVRVMGRDFTRARDNVFLVSGIDGPAPRVAGLGTHDLQFAAQENPAVALLRRAPPVLAALLGEAPSTGAAARRDHPSELATLDRQGQELLTRNEEGAACALFRKAAERGYAPSQYRLGICFGNGTGMPLDLAAANQWYQKAAEQGFRDAQYKLAHSYRVGRGTEVDLPAALHWYTKAAENGDEQARLNVALMYATGHGAEIDQGKAFGWYLKAAENGSAEAQYIVARMYRDGEGVRRDLTSSYAWLLALRPQRWTVDRESWKSVEALLASVEAGLGDEEKAKGRARAQGLMRSVTRAYLEGLRR